MAWACQRQEEWGADACLRPFLSAMASGPDACLLALTHTPQRLFPRLVMQDCPALGPLATNPRKASSKGTLCRPFCARGSAEVMGYAIP